VNKLPLIVTQITVPHIATPVHSPMSYYNTCSQSNVILQHLLTVQCHTLTQTDSEPEEGCWQSFMWTVM